MSFSTYDFILILSRNDFLPITDEDIHSFNTLSLFIPKALTPLISKRTKEQSENLFNTFINLHPEFHSLELSDQRTYSKHDSSEHKTIILKDNFILKLNSLFQDSITVDLKHMERVLLLGELLNTLRHELSNPIFGITLAAELLYSSYANHELISDFSHQILKAAKRSQQILDSFSKLYSNQSEFIECNIKDIVTETIVLTKSETKMIPKNISWNMFISSQDYIIYSNPTWISQIVFNFIVNAAQALKESETSSPSIEINITKGNKAIVIHVSDNGPGIPQAIASILLNPFFTTKNKGTGLGLSICENLIKRLEGTLTFGNNKKFGAFFCVSIPVNNEKNISR